MIKIKRVYDKPSKEDGFRILIDRLWPRGLTKEKAKIDLWLREIAPSDKLRKWFSHDLRKWEGFKRKYIDELKTKKELIDKIKLIEKEQKVMLLFSAKDKKHNNANVLHEFLIK